MRLENKVALVTGAGRGWGRGIAMALANHGAKVAVVSRTAEEIETTGRLIGEQGGTVFTLNTDLGDQAGVDYTLKQVSQNLGPLDILVNNAAILYLKNFTDLSMDEIEQKIQVNLMSYLRICHQVLPNMISRKKGHIINVSSNAGIWPFEKETIYAACKFGIEGFSQSLALETAKYGISVNTITPGATERRIFLKPTSMTQKEFENLNTEEQARYADPMLYTEAFVFLASQEGADITGQRILAYELSEMIRETGWDIPYHPMTQVRPGWR